VSNVDERPRWRLYVDGSCLGNQHVDAATPAAWGLVVVEGDSGLGKGSGELRYEDAGNVVTAVGEPGHIGAEVGSNNTAELSGFAAALRWLLMEGGDDGAEIRADSVYAGNLASGTWRAKANRALVAHVQALWDEVDRLRPLSWSHVKAHRGHRWNERADHLAARKAQGELPIPLTFWKPGQR
jgi:ribonuclease HI